MERAHLNNRPSALPVGEDDALVPRCHSTTILVVVLPAYRPLCPDTSTHHVAIRLPIPLPTIVLSLLLLPPPFNPVPERRIALLTLLRHQSQCLTEPGKMGFRHPTIGHLFRNL